MQVEMKPVVVRIGREVPDDAGATTNGSEDEALAFQAVALELLLFN